MELLSVIRRWHFGIISRSGRSRGARVCRGTRSANTCGPTWSSRSSRCRTARASWIPSPTSYRPGCGRRAASHASRGGRSSNCTPIWSPLATTAPTIAWRRLPASGRSTGSGSSRPPAGACSCRWLSRPARRSSSTGARTGRSSAASGQVAGGARQALLQPRLHYPRLSAADPRDAVRRP